MKTKNSKKINVGPKNINPEPSSVDVEQQHIDYQKKIKSRIADLIKITNALEKEKENNFKMFKIIKISLLLLSVAVGSFESIKLLSFCITVFTFIDVVFQPQKLWFTQEQTIDDLFVLIDHCKNGVCEFRDKSYEDSFHLLYEESDRILQNNRQSQRDIHNNQSISKNEQKPQKNSENEESN